MLTRRVLLSAGLGSLLAFAAAIPLSAAESDSKFVVHEWGVLVLNRTDTGIELGPPAAMPSALPAFVLRHDTTYKPKRQDHGWDKPVIHLYGPEGLAVKLSVGTPMGKPIAYWPAPTTLSEKMGKAIVSKREMMVYTLSEVTALNWQGTLSAHPTGNVAAGDPNHWWQSMRDVPSMYLNTPKGSERFVFYEATANQSPAVTAEISADALTLRNAGTSASGPVVVIVNDGQSRWAVSADPIPAGGVQTLARKQVCATPLDDAGTLALCAAQWKAMGMTATEAEQIVKVWRSDLLKTPGVMVIARMPAEAYDRMFPLTVTPKPDELVRVGLIFDSLAGQKARVEWLPGLKTMLDQWATGLSAGSFKQREEAAARFEQLGDLAHPFLEGLAAAGDPEKSRAAAVLLRSAKSPASQPSP